MRELVLRIAMLVWTSATLAYIMYRRTIRRIEWFFLRQIILRRIRLCSLLETFVAKEFQKYPAAKGISLRVYYRRGYGTGESSEKKHTLYWEAPLAIAIWTEKGPAAGMAVELRWGALCIRQLQGVAGVPLSKELPDWPKTFVEACLRFARRTGVRHVRLYRADQSLFYYWPMLPKKEGRTRYEMLEEHRQRMRRRYDGTARQMGFNMKKKWGEWEKPRA